MVRFDTPGFAIAGAAAAVLVIALHLFSLRLPRPRDFPTARFIPARPSRRPAPRLAPDDFALMLVRAAVVMLVGFALARPDIRPGSAGMARVVVADRSRAVADAAEVRDSVSALVAEVAVSTLIVFDSVARVAPAGTMEVPATPGRLPRGRLSGALVAAIREGTRLARSHDSVEIAVVSPLLREEMDAAVSPIRAVWHGTVRHVPVRGASGAGGDAPVGDAVLPPPGDPVGAAARLASDVSRKARLRLVRRPPNGDDSAFAASGGAVVAWPPAEVPDSAEGVRGLVTSGAAAAIGHYGPPRDGSAPLPVPPRAEVVLRWGDGSPAAWQEARGPGCLRAVAVATPVSGDEVISASFVGIVGELIAPCERFDPTPAPSAVVAGLIGGAGVVSTSALEPAAAAPASVTRVLLGLAVALLLLEWILRRRTRHHAVGLPGVAEVERAA